MRLHLKSIDNSQQRGCTCGKSVNMTFFELNIHERRDRLPVEESGKQVFNDLQSRHASLSSGWMEFAQASPASNDDSLPVNTVHALFVNTHEPFSSFALLDFGWIISGSNKERPRSGSRTK